MSGLTVKQTPLKGPGSYTTTTPTKAGGAGELKPFGAGTANNRSITIQTKSPYFGGKRGSDAATSRLLKNKPRTIF